MISPGSSKTPDERTRCEVRAARHEPGTVAVARMLIEAGGPADGRPGDKETPLIIAASYGDAEVARALIEAGADIASRQQRLRKSVALRGSGRIRPGPPGVSCSHAPDLNVLTLRR